MKRLLIFCSLVTTMMAQAACPEFNPPSTFKAREQLISVGTDMILTGERGNIIGEIEERTMRLTPSFDLYNDQGKKVASARQKIFSWGTSMDVLDCEGKLLGTVRENIFTSLLGIPLTRYDILDSKGNVIAASIKTEFFFTKFSITSSKNEPVVTMTRPAVRVLSDVWTIQLQSKSIVDPRITTMIPAFKTSADNKALAEEE